MQPTRRRYLAVAGTGIGVGVAGCLSSGSNITYPESTDGPDDSGNGAENPEEPEEPSGEPVNSRLAEETTRIYDELRWFETEYQNTMREYRSRLRGVNTEVESLLETLSATGRLDTAPLEAAEAHAAEVASTVTDIPEPQFTNHIAFSTVNNEVFPEAKRFRDRKDWDRVKDELKYAERIYGDASTIRATTERYSPNPVDNRLYGWLGEADSGTMFEMRHLSDDRAQHDDAEQRLPGHGVYVVADSSREIEYLDRPMGGRRYDLLSSMDDLFEPFAVPTDRRYRLYVRIHDVGTSGDIDPTATEPIEVYGQRYEDLVAAEEAFNTVVADEEFELQLEGQTEYGEETWNEVLYTKDGNRFYAYFFRADSYLFVVDPSQTPWEERDDEWTELLSGTWLNP